MKLSQRLRPSALASSVALQIFVTFFVIYAITSSGGLEVADSETRYRTAKSILEGNGGALPWGHGPIGMPGRGGHLYSFYGPLQSILMMPAVELTNWLAPGNSEQLFKLVFGVIGIPLVSALSLATLFGALRSLRFDERTAFFTVAMVGLATPMWHYGRSGQEENLIGFAFSVYLWGMGLLFRERASGLLLVATAASIIVATRWSYLPALGIMMIPVALLLWQRRVQWRSWWRSLAISSAGASVVLGAVFWYNIYRFGRPFETGYGVYFKTHPAFTFGQAPNHIAALMVSPYRGLLWFCPLLIVLFGLWNAPKRRPEAWLHRTAIAALIFTWLFIGCFAIWTAGPAWAPRYLVALVVLLAPAFASVFASGQRWRAVVAVSILVQLCSTLLPSSSEDFVFAMRNLEHPGSCTPWTCSCGALCMRGPWALRAIGNTITSRALPVIELTSEAQAQPPPQLETSDFNSVYWWPVRAAYRAHKLSPALAFVVCLLGLSAAIGALWFFYRRLPPSSRDAGAVPAPEP